jgi:hypothetical protein
MVYCAGSAKLKSKATGEIFEVHPSDLAWDHTSEERQMGAEVCYTASVEFETSDGGSMGCTWQVWEYPIGVENMKETTPDAAELISDFDYGL